MALKRDPLELRLYSALKTAQQRVSGWPCSMPVPVLCTVGMQSAGKTTFIEALVGFRVGTTCTGTGTRCPVRYILKEGPPHFAVSGKTLKERRDIQVAVECHMQGLALQPKDADRFSKEELRVEITDYDLPLLDITDLPGLKAKGEGAEEIKSVVRFYVESQSARPVVLVKATESVETQADVELLRDVGIDPKKGNVTFVVNYFNDQLYKFSKASELNEYCRGYVQEYGCVYFCMLIYSQEAKDAKDHLDFDGEMTYYRQLPVKEKETFEQKILSISKDVEFHEEDVLARFGVVPAIQRMQSIIREFIVREGRKYSDKLRPLEEEQAANLRSVQKELKRCNPEYIKEQRERYVEKWGEVVRDIQKCRMRPDNESELNPIKCGTTFFQELKQVHSLNDRTTLLGEGLKEDPSASDVRKWWQDAVRRKNKEAAASDVDNLLGMELTADASLQRLSDAFDLVVDAQVTHQGIQENEMRSISGYAPGDMPGALDHLQVIKEVATRPLAHVRTKIWPMLIHVEVIFSQALERAHSTLKGHPGFAAALQVGVTQSYLRLIRSKIHEAEERFKILITEKTSHIPVDKDERLALSSILQSRRNFDRGFGAVCGSIFALALYGAHVQRSRAVCGGCAAAGSVVAAGIWWASVPSQIKEVNNVAAKYYKRLRKELLRQFRTVIANHLFSYLDRSILLDVRDDLRQQIRDADARRIDEDTRARASELRKKEGEVKESLGHIQLVLELIEQLENSQVQGFVSTESLSTQADEATSNSSSNSLSR